MRRVLVPLADGFEEIEAVTIVDILRRAGLEVVVARVGSVTAGGPVVGSRGLRLVADAGIDEIADEPFDAIVLPGGLENARALREDARVQRLVSEMHSCGRLVGAICAAPWSLEPTGLLDRRQFTCHPGVAARLGACRRSEERVVVDGDLVTSQGPGTAMEFAFALVERLAGADRAREVNQGVLARL